MRRQLSKSCRWFSCCFAHEPSGNRRRIRQAFFKGRQLFNPVWIIAKPGKFSSDFFNATGPVNTFGDEYSASETERVMANHLYEVPLRRFQLYFLAAILFVTGGLLANLEGLVEEIESKGGKDSEWCCIAVIQSCGKYGITYSTIVGILVNCSN